MIGLEEALFRLEIFRELVKRDISKISENTGNQETLSPPINLNSYALKYGVSVSKMADMLKQTLIDELDDLAELEKGLITPKELENTYKEVDSAIGPFHNVKRRQNALIIEGDYAKYVLDIFDSEPGVLAVCPGDHFVFGDVYPCVSTLGDIDKAVGLEGLPDEVKERTALAVNIAAGNSPFGPGDEGPMPEFERFVAPSLCPACASDGRVDKDTVELFSDQLDVPKLLKKIRLERTGVHGDEEDWRRELRELEESPRHAVRFLDRRLLIKTALGGS